MTEKMMDSVSAINKWFYFSLNYPVKYYDGLKTDFGVVEGEVLPTFITEIKWSCGLNHMIEKWKAVEKSNSRARMNEFYGELDGDNRKLLLEWVMENYNDEQKMDF